MLARARTDDGGSTEGWFPDCSTGTNTVTCTDCTPGYNSGGKWKAGNCITRTCTVHDTSGTVACSTTTRPYEE